MRDFGEDIFAWGTESLSGRTESLSGRTESLPDLILPSVDFSFLELLLLLLDFVLRSLVLTVAFDFLDFLLDRVWWV